MDLDSGKDDYFFLSASVDKTIGVWKGHDDDVRAISRYSKGEYPASFFVVSSTRKYIPLSDIRRV